MAKFVGLKYGTFYKHYKNTITPQLKKKSLGTGPRSFLGEPLEDEIIKHIDNLWVRGFPLTWWSVKQIARDIAKANGIDGFMASNGWCKRLKIRYPILGSRVAQGFERTRVGALNPEQTQKYMELVREAISTVEALNGGLQFTPDLLLNLDETGFDPVNNQDLEVICLKTRRGATYSITSSDRTHCSAAVCITAAGARFATMYALKGARRLYRNLPNCPEGTAYVMTEKGYFGDEAFDKYIKFLVAQIPKDGKWRLLILDGYGSHTMVPSVLDYLVANQIHAICMPSHSSEFLQPLDISCFSPTKGEFRKDLREILLQFSIGAVTRWHLPAVFELALQFGCTEGNIKGGFKACGLWPFDIDWVSKNPEKFKVSEDLDALEQRTKAATFDPMHCTPLSMAQKVHEMHSKIVKNLQLPGLDEPTRKCLAEFEKDLQQEYIPLSERLSKIFAEPVKASNSQLVASKKRKVENSIGESYSAAKWLTMDARRDSVRALAAAIAAQNEQAAEDKVAKAQAKAQKEAAKIIEQRKQQPLFDFLLRLGYVELEESQMSLEHLKAFYVKNKAIIDEFVGGQIGKTKQTKKHMISLFLEKDLVNSGLQFV